MRRLRFLRRSRKILLGMLIVSLVLLAIYWSYQQYLKLSTPVAFSVSSCSSALAPEPGETPEIEGLSLSPDETALLWIDKSAGNDKNGNPTQFAGVFLYSLGTLSPVDNTQVAVIQLDSNDQAQRFSVALSFKGATATEQNAHCLLLTGDAQLVNAHLLSVWPRDHQEGLLWASPASQKLWTAALRSGTLKVTLDGADTPGDLAYLG